MTDFRGKIEAAVKEYTSSLRYIPSAVIFSNRAHARLKLGDFKARPAGVTVAMHLDDKIAKHPHKKRA